LFGFINKFVLNNTDFIIFNSSYTLEKANNLISNNNCCIIHPCHSFTRKIVDSNIFKEKLFQKLEISNRNKVVFFLGRHVEKKGLKFLLKATQILLNKTNNFILLIGSEGVLTESLKLYSKKLGISEKTFFVGRIRQEVLDYYYSISDVFVAPSIIDSNNETETLGVVLQEALFNSTPVVASRVGGIVDIVEDSINGFLVEEKNPIELSEKILHLLNNKDIAIKMGKLGSEKIEEKFSVKTTTLKIVEVYESLTYE